MLKTRCWNAQSLCSVKVKPCEVRGTNWAYPVVRPHALGRRHKSKGCWTVVLSRCLKGRHWDSGTNPKSGTQRWDIGRDSRARPSLRAATEQANAVGQRMQTRCGTGVAV